MNTKLGMFFLIITFLTLSFFNLNSVLFWDITFIIGLFMLIIGGFLYLIEKRVFDGFLQNFILFKKKNSKVEKYISTSTHKEIASKKLIDVSLTTTILKIGIGLILLSILISYYKL